MIENATHLTGDAREILRTLPAESVHCVVCSPPYLGLRDYSAPASIWGGKEDCAHKWGDVVIGKAQRQRNGVSEGIHAGRAVNGLASIVQTEHVQGSFCKCGAWRGCLGSEPTIALYLEHIVEVFKEVWRVLRKDGTVWINMGDGYTSGGRTGHGTRIGYKQGTNQGSVDAGDWRLPTPPGMKPKDRMGQPHRLVFALQDAGWYWRDEIVWQKASPMPGSQQDRCTNSHEFVFMLTKKAKYYYDLAAISEPVTGGAHARGNGVNPRSRNTPRGGEQGPRNHQNESWSAAGGGLVATRTKRSVWRIPAQPFVAEMCTSCGAYYHEGAKDLPKHKDGENERPICKCGKWDSWLSHYASFPEALPAECIKAGTSEAGCCAECGAPWKRVTEKVGGKKKTPAPPNGRTMGKHRAQDRTNGARMLQNLAEAREESGSHNQPFAKGGYRSGNKARKLAELCPSSPRMGSSIPWDSAEAQTLTLGWVPTCKCLAGDPVPCTVLDIFNGTGRSGLAALRLGRRYIGVDVKSEYIELSRNYLTEELRRPPLIEAILTQEAEQLELNL